MQISNIIHCSSHPIDIYFCFLFFFPQRTQAPPATFAAAARRAAALVARGSGRVAGIAALTTVVTLAYDVSIAAVQCVVVFCV
jgi:hypothetical protein